MDKKLALSKTLIQKLKEKQEERNTELILDYLEQIEEHKKAIKALMSKIAELTEVPIDANIRVSKKNK